MQVSTLNIGTGLVEANFAPPAIARTADRADNPAASMPSPITPVSTVPTARGRYGRVYWLMLRNSLIREMSFKANFIGWLAVEVLWFAGQIIFLEVIFGHVDRIGDWNKWECVLLLGTHQIIAQIFQAFFYVNVSELPDLVRTGRLDLFLLQPIDSQFSVSVRRFGFDSFVTSLVGGVIVVFSLTKLGIMPGAGQVALYLVCCALGLGIHYSILFGLATLSIWIVRAQGLIYGYYNIFNVARYPADVFRGAFRFIFSWIIPVMLVANVPARILVRGFENPWPNVLHLAAATALVVGATRLFWFFALKRYSSASS